MEIEQLGYTLKLNSSSSFVDPGIWSWALWTPSSCSNVLHDFFHIVMCLKLPLGIHNYVAWSIDHPFTMLNVLFNKEGFCKCLPSSRIRFRGLLSTSIGLFQRKDNLGSRDMKHCPQMESLRTWYYTHSFFVGYVWNCVGPKRIVDFNNKGQCWEVPSCRVAFTLSGRRTPL